MKDNGIFGFNLSDPSKLDDFINTFRRYSLDKKLKGTRILENNKYRPLSAKDRRKMQFFLEIGLSDSEFNAIDIIGPVNQVATRPVLKKALSGFKVGHSSLKF